MTTGRAEAFSDGVFAVAITLLVIGLKPTGHGTLTQQRLHQLIREPGSIEDRTFEISFLEPGAEAYAFTFG